MKRTARRQEDLSDLVPGDLKAVQVCLDWLRDLGKAQEEFGTACRAILSLEKLPDHLKHDAFRRAMLKAWRFREQLGRRPYQRAVATRVVDRLSPWLDAALVSCARLEVSFRLGKVPESNFFRTMLTIITALGGPLEEFQELLVFVMVQRGGNTKAAARPDEHKLAGMQNHLGQSENRTDLTIVTAKVKRDPKNRDSSIYFWMAKKKSLQWIKNKVKANKKWESLSSLQAVSAAGRRFAKKHNLPWPVQR
jgi:hypothetical protein